MKGKQLTIQDVAKLEHGTKVYRECRGIVKLELVSKTRYSSIVRTCPRAMGDDNYNELTEDCNYYEYVDGVKLPTMPEITFDTIRYAVATCKFRNDQCKRIGNPQLYPGIDEAYELLNNIAAKPNGMSTKYILDEESGSYEVDQTLYSEGE
ncbi:hypothetical protein [Cellulosilyticum sp. WCF-2]|uniref:hypothetical protein n=1 Tax=Cellulosilyticum sp. WCF-2 TaxID=2497860 RepID=UPI000F8C7943|nr:hypothetical protein [Cellulosilyticum sp. WCF-2]QEH69754.1 hypothetical protein EKH84_15670 [Cellulosilyticum sp. WCF-2]